MISRFNLTYWPGQPGSMSYHLTFQYGSLGLLALCLARIAALIVNLIHIGWMAHSPKTRSPSWLEPPKPNLTSNRPSRSTEAKWRVVDWVQRQIQIPFDIVPTRFFVFGSIGSLSRETIFLIFGFSQGHRDHPRPPLTPYIPTCLEILSSNNHTGYIWGLPCEYQSIWRQSNS